MRWISKRKALWIWAGYTLAAVLVGALLAGAAISGPTAGEEPQAVAAFAMLDDEMVDNLFAVEAVTAESPMPSGAVATQPEATPAPSDGGFRIEVVRDAATQAQGKRVLIYHTHTYEAYEQTDAVYAETQKWRTADKEHNMVRVGRELERLLTAKGFVVTHDTTAFEPPKLSSAYARSLSMLEARTAAGESYDLYIDLHRDAYTASQKGSNTVQTAAGPCARLMLLIGKGEGQTEQGFDQRPDWESNLAIARQLTDALNTQEDGLCKEVCLKSGRFNQHIAPCCVLVEAGNNRNTLEEALAAMPYLADAIAGLP